MRDLLRKWNSVSLVKRIIIGMVLGAILGVAAPKAVAIGMLGTLFVGGLKAVAPVLVFVLVIAAICQHQSGQKTNMKSIIVLYLVGTFSAALIAVIASFAFPIKLILAEGATDVTAPGGIAEVLRKRYPNMELHASTQISAHSLNDVLELKQVGFDRVVIARELGIEEIKEICDNVDIDIEVFIHGAICVSYSGQCLMSSMLGDRSGNRGRCAQPCRQSYKLINKTTGKIIGAVIGGSDSEVKVKDTKYKFSGVEMEVDQYTAVITGTLTHNGSTKKNLRLSIPCFDKKGNRVGDAIATIDELEKDKKWKFRAVLNEENVAACKIKDAYITVE